MEYLRTAATDELMQAVEQYPWFAAARKELCLRLGQGSAAALYVYSRVLLQPLGRADLTDRNINDLIRRAPERRIHVERGDFFSQEQYDEVRGDASTEVPSFRGLTPVSEDTEAAVVRGTSEGSALELCTETLAQIYEQQGYYDQAKYIYSKLSLLYPEKSVYFAALIEKIDSKTKN